MGKKLVDLVSGSPDFWNKISQQEKELIASLRPEIDDRVIEITTELSAHGKAVDLFAVINEVEAENAPEEVSAPVEEPKDKKGFLGFFTGMFNRKPKEKPVNEPKVGPKPEVQTQKGSNKPADLVKWIGLIVVGVAVIVFLFFGQNIVQKIPTFVSTPEVISGSGPIWNFTSGTVQFTIRHAPKNFNELISNWLGVLIMLILMRFYITTFMDETNDRKEPRDHQSVLWGWVVFLAVFAFADGLAPWLVDKCAFFQGKQCLENADAIYWVILIVTYVGAFAAIGASFGASVSGNWDATPLGVGFFLVGIVFKLFWPEQELAARTLLSIALLIQIYEMWRHKNDRSSLTSGLITALFASLTAGVLVILGAKTIGFLSPYRLAIGFVMAVLVAFATASTSVQKKVSGVFPGPLRENIPDRDSIYFDIKLFVLMIAILIIIF